MPRFLMVGGPLDGQVKDLPGYAFWVVPIEPERELARPVSPATSDREPRTAVYDLVTVNVFGVLLAVYVLQDMSPYDRDRTTARHLLSPLALDLAHGQGLGHAKPQAAG